jgi:hypothetical protein
MEREADRPIPSSAEVRMREVVPYVIMAWCLINHRDRFIFSNFEYWMQAAYTKSPAVP